MYLANRLCFVVTTKPTLYMNSLQCINHNHVFMPKHDMFVTLKHLDNSIFANVI